MAWYRAGGGGIPSAIKTDMNAVLNKKFGTSTDYPPTDWAPSVNLLGPLPEKTASGVIASFSDGADGVPLKNWGVTVDATLSGVSSVVCTQTGKNLFNKDATPYQTGKYIISTSVIGSSDFTYTNNANYNVYRIKIDKNTSYVISSIKANAPCWGLMSTSGLVTYVYPNNGGSEGVNITLTTGATDAYLFVSVAVTGTYKCDDIVQIEKGSTATTYEQYNAKTNTVSLGQTIYGGEADVVNGTGTETYKHVQFTGDASENWSYNNGVVFISLDDMPKPSGHVYGTYITEGMGNDWDAYLAFGLGIKLPSTITSVTDWKTYLNNNPLDVTYELATGTDFTFTPITPTPETALGTNNFWADTGDSEVTYRADIDLLLGGN